MTGSPSKTPQSPLRESLSRELAELQRIDRKRSLRVLSHRQGTTAMFDGRPLFNLSSNDYLGLGSDETLRHEFQEKFAAGGLDAFGMAGSSSRLLSGNHPPYAELEQDLSALYGGRPACIFNSGYHANVGICAALAGKGDLILCDRLDHASILDGARLSEADLKRYPHADYAHLERLLQNARPAYRHIFIVSETVFSMDGDVADLERLLWLKEHYGAVLILDEAHALGVFGDNGLGVCEAQHGMAGVDIIVGTFGKALASLGAFAISDAVIHDYLINKMRPLIFTTALPPAVVSWTRMTMRHMVDMRAERERLVRLGEFLRAALDREGLATGGTSQIVPVVLGADAAATHVAGELQKAGYLVFPIRPPTVPPGSARLRLSLCANMTEADVIAVAPLIKAALTQAALPGGAGVTAS